jgi:hypothetical protein
MLGLGEQPGRVAMLGVAAHSGRELTNGILKELGVFEQLTREEREEAAESEEEVEEHSAALARALGRSKDDPAVRQWHRIHRDLVSAAHYRGMAASEKRARRAIPALTVVLDALLGPYFEVAADLQAVLNKTEPSEDDFVTVMAALAKQQLRLRCFRGFNGPGWLKGLEARGCFGEPPKARRHDGDSWSPEAWVEGEYLARVAGDEPAAVATILRRVPVDNDNPVVWDTFAKCQLAMPAATAASL